MGTKKRTVRSEPITLPPMLEGERDQFCGRIVSNPPVEGEQAKVFLLNKSEDELVITSPRRGNCTRFVAAVGDVRDTLQELLARDGRFQMRGNKIAVAWSQRGSHLPPTTFLQRQWATSVGDSCMVVLSKGRDVEILNQEVEMSSQRLETEEEVVRRMLAGETPSTEIVQPGTPFILRPKQTFARLVGSGEVLAVSIYVDPVEA